MKALVTTIIAGAIGFAAARLVSAPTAPSSPPPAERVVVQQVRTLPAATRDEAPVRSSTPPAANPEPTEVTVRARKDIEDVVAAAVASRRWTEADRERVRATALSPRDKLELLRPMIVAANNDELDIAVAGPVL